jgi:hypothetical protein
MAKKTWAVGPNDTAYVLEPTITIAPPPQLSFDKELGTVRFSYWNGERWVSECLV